YAFIEVSSTVFMIPVLALHSPNNAKSTKSRENPNAKSLRKLLLFPHRPGHYWQCATCACYVYYELRYSIPTTATPAPSLSPHSPPTTIPLSPIPPANFITSFNPLNRSAFPVSHPLRAPLNTSLVSTTFVSTEILAGLPASGGSRRRCSARSRCEREGR